MTSGRADYAIDILAGLTGVSSQELIASGLLGNPADTEFLASLPAIVDPSDWIELSGERVPVWNSRPGEPPDLIASTFYQASLAADWSRAASPTDPHGRQLAIDAQRTALGVL